MALGQRVVDLELLAQLEGAPPETPMSPMSPMSPEAPSKAPKGAVTDPALLAQLESPMPSEGNIGASEAPQGPSAPLAQSLLSSNSQDFADTLADWSGLAQSQSKILGENGVRRLGTPEALVQAGGNVAAGVGKVGMAGLSKVDDVLTGGTGKEVAIAGITKAFEALQSTKAGRKVIGLAMQGGDVWEAYKKFDPQTAKTIGSAVEVGLLVAPGPKVKVNIPFRKLIGGLLEGSLDRTMKRRGKDFDIILGEDSLQKGRGPVQITGVTSRVSNKPTPWEEQRNATVASVKGVSKNNLDAKNHMLVRDAAEAERMALEAKIIKQGNTDIPKDQLTDELFKMQEDIMKSDELFALRGNKEVARYTEDLMYKAYDLVQKSDGTALGVLNARRQFDGWVDKAAGGFDQGKITAKNYATTLIRNKLNDAVETAVPNAQVRESLLKQHYLLNARDKFLANADKVGRDIPERVVESISNKFHVGPVGLKSIAAGIAGYLSIGLPATVSLGAVTGILMQMPKTLRNKTLASAISKIGTAMKSAKGEPLKELTIQRATLIEILRESQSVASDAQTEMQAPEFQQRERGI